MPESTAQQEESCTEAGGTVAPLPLPMDRKHERPAPVAELHDDRRASPRFTLLIQTAKLISHHGEFLCIVRDASEEGVRVRHFGFLPPDEYIEFQLANGEKFTVQLVWQNEEYAGLKFNNDVRLDRIVKLSNGNLPKRQLRLETQLQGSLRFSDINCDVTIRNLSQQGACIESEEVLAVHQLVRIEAEDLEPIFAKVRWRKANIYGLVFEETLGLARLAEIVAQANVADNDEAEPLSANEA
ncbi:MAG TPA: PilZ domain-containing protein [Sphingomonadaceae bacterium]|nr:PilZ domain-containing protein [Sphingomonadaceae bacterium]